MPTQVPSNGKTAENTRRDVSARVPPASAIAIADIATMPMMLAPTIPTASHFRVDVSAFCGTFAISGHISQIRRSRPVAFPGKDDLARNSQHVRQPHRLKQRRCPRFMWDGPGKVPTVSTRSFEPGHLA